MNKQNVRQFTMALGLLAMVIGCATAGKDLIESGTVTIQRLDSKHVYLSDVSVVEKEDHIEISGWVKKHYGWSVGNGHVARGEAIEKISTDYTPGVIPRKGNRRSHFKAALPLRTLERGSSVWVGFHRNEPRHSDGVFDCGENVAVLHAGDV